MSKYILIMTSLLFTILSCQPKSTDTTEKIDLSQYPTELQSIFKAHGGLDLWNEQKGMSYEIVKEGQNEKQLIDLKDRRERIEASNITMGYDGTKIWAESDTTYKGNPVFYKNLMFYFYAMPFVLADEGINYTTVPAITFDSIDYPGIKISYDSGVGESPEDEYFLHYNAETKQMEWLGYTVTYFSKEKSPAIKWIRYDDWKDYKGLMLPNSLAWYTLEDNLPIRERNRREFVNVELTKIQYPDNTFIKTDNAKVVSE